MPTKRIDPRAKKRQKAPKGAKPQTAICNTQTTIRKPQYANRNTHHVNPNTQTAIRKPQYADRKTAIRKPQYAIRKPQYANHKPQNQPL